MSLPRKLRARLVSLYLSEGFQRLRRRVLALRRSSGVTFFHQPDDPHSHLLLQLMPDLQELVPVRVVLVPPPDAVFTPDAERLRAWGRRDAALLARRYRLSLPEGQPDSALLTAAQARAVEADDDLDALVRIGDALFAGDTAAFDGSASSGVDAKLAEGAALRDAWGHYLGGMLHYGGEWYWGVDRLDLLLHRLAEEGLDTNGILPPPRDVDVEPAQDGATLEFFYSFRSPYSYLAIQPVLDLAERTGVPLRIRPVLPMVMRGLAVPKRKVLYIARDAARLARQQGQPFGLVCDPVGPGILSCMALFACAQQHGLEAALLRSAGRGIWAEGLDITERGDLRTIATRAGLDWTEAEGWLGRPEVIALAEDNRQALLDAGLWGVPSFRCGGVAIWGQDRLFVLDELLSE